MCGSLSGHCFRHYPDGQRMTWHLRNEDHLLNEKRIRRLMRMMGLMPIYQKPDIPPPLSGSCCA